MSDGSKRFRGQIQTYEGGTSGESIAVTLLDYNALGLVEFVGEAKYGALESANTWYIQRFEYSNCGNVTAVKTAINQIYPQVSRVSVDVITAPGTAILTLVGADLDLISIGDRVFLKTPTNFIGGAQIVSMTPTEIRIVDDGYLAETNTPIIETDMTIGLLKTEVKDFGTRRWDKRHLYVYQ